jgi:hypothetical protein
MQLRAIDRELKKRNEEVELDELKKSTLGSYVRKASVDTYRRGQDTEYHTAARDATDNYGAKRRHAELTDKARAKASNRITGIEKATRKLAKEEYMDEAFKAGSMKLSDGSSVKVTSEEASTLNALFNQLNSSNKTKMNERLMSDSKGFDEILAFAKEAV